MPVQPISFGFTTNPSRNDTQGYLVNLYSENLGNENESRTVLYACEGFVSYHTLTGGGVLHGMMRFDDERFYIASGNTLQKVTSQATSTNLAALTFSSDYAYAYFARNRKEPNAQVAVVTTDGLFRLIENDVVTTPTVDPDIPTFTSVCGIDGYFVLTAANGEWFITAIDEGATIDDLEFAQANTKPDAITRGIVRGRDLFICGPQSIEVYQNTGADDFPFERVTSIGIGVHSGPSMQNVTAVVDGGTQDVLIFAGNNSDGTYAGVMLMDGYQCRTISPFALDRAIMSEPQKASISAFTYAANGHVFYVIQGTTFSWQYDATTTTWTVRQSLNSTRWNIGGSCAMNGYTMLANQSSGAIYYLETSPQAPASASTVAMRHSNDNGGAWSTSRSKSVGTARTKRVRWHSLGQSREDGKVFELTFSNAIVEAGTNVSAKCITPPVQGFPARMIFNALYCNITSGVSQTTNHKGFITLAVDVDPATP